MLVFFSHLILSLMINSILVFDFNENSNLSKWRVIDDVVMGGRSNGSLTLNEKGYAVFSGDVSLENNGGFSSLRYNGSPIILNNHTKCVLYLKGDKKKYQFRLRENRNDYQSYIISFKTTGDWQKIEIPLDELVPSFRGRELNMPNFQSIKIEELGFLIGNKKNESFKLEIDKIEIE